MYRLVTQIQNKYLRGPCGPPYKKFFEFQQKTSPTDLISTKKNFIVQNFGESYLYHSLKSQKLFLPDQSLPTVRSNIVLVLGLSNQSLNQIIKPLNDQNNQIIEIEIIKNRNKRNLLIVVFQQNHSAENFYLQYNFSMMPDQSHLVTIFLSDVIYVKASEAKHPDQIHLLLTSNIISQHDKDKEKNTEWTQLPLCLSCLQKIESRISGIHYLFSGQQITIHKPSVNCSLCTLLKQSAQCHLCNQTKQIWGCLICGILGCGRYKQGHAQVHSFQNNHIFALEIKTNRIWSYQQDTFVHRVLGEDLVGLLENELGENQGENTDGISWDFCCQITEQLEKQRGYYELKVEEQEKGFWKEKEELEKELREVKETVETRIKEAAVMKGKRDKEDRRKNQIRLKIEEQKQLNKLAEFNIKSLSQQPVYQSETIKRKKLQIKQLDAKLTQLLCQLDFS